MQYPSPTNALQLELPSSPYAPKTPQQSQSHGLEPHYSHSSTRTRSRSRRPAAICEDPAASSTPPQRSSFPNNVSPPPLSPKSPRSRIARILELQDEQSGVSGSSMYGSRTRARNSTFSSDHSPLLPIDGLMAAYPAYGRHNAQASSSTSALPWSPPSTFLSRSTSLKSDRTDRYRHRASHKQQLSPNANQPRSPETPLGQEQEQDWSSRARRWSTSMSRRMSISTLNQTISASTSPYIKAGLDELRSIFDVESIGVFDITAEDGRFRVNQSDLEDCPLDMDSSSRSDSTCSPATGDIDHENVGFFPFAQGSGNLVESPSEASVRTSLDPSRPPLHRSGDTLQHRTGQEGCAQLERSDSASSNSARKRRGFVLVNQGSRTNSKLVDAPPLADGTGKRGKLSVSALVAVGLTATAVGIAAVCAFEATIHPDAVPLPLIVFMLAQPAFAVLGLAGLLCQKRLLMDLSSRLLRAHVLCQALIALTALRHLSESAFYRRSTNSGHSTSGTFASQHEMWSGPASRFSVLISIAQHTQDHSFDPATSPHHANVGSIQDQLTYLIVFLAQALVPLAVTLWAQYRIAMKLVMLARSSQASAVVPPATESGRLSRKQSLQRRTRTQAIPDGKRESTRAGSQCSNEKPVALAAPAPVLDFKLDAADLSSRLEHLQTAMRAESTSAFAGRETLDKPMPLQMQMPAVSTAM